MHTYVSAYEDTYMYIHMDIRMYNTYTYTGVGAARCSKKMPERTLVYEGLKLLLVYEALSC